MWAKVGSSPWWPAKTLDPQRDPSYPPDADPPRPTSIPIRCALPHFLCERCGMSDVVATWLLLL